MLVLSVVLLYNFVKNLFARAGLSLSKGGILSEHMSKITRDDVLKLAKLSRLTLTDSEVEQFAAEMTAILQYVEQLQSADVAGLEPTYQVTGLKNVMRPDEEKSYGPSPEALLKNAPATEKAHFKVKRMIV